ncbi:MAG: DNA polymerase III subunit gamma/tau [Desulfovibrionaceae bacterium]|nr:DNA polymerase III subunit gamma/tau [Desulfovibrionaceae bacterium]
MNYASLAVKYRPQTFAEVTGQDSVKAALSRAAAEDRVAAAYLLSGTRGVGKTTLARIFAKALNCEHAPAAEPCNSCEACRRIMQGIHVDVIEMDGASQRGIDDARELRERVLYAPMEGRYKVVIIDEAHMLSREAFNALLKTIEEPPARTTFIFASTEAHKFPITILSRCQHFVLKSLPEKELETHLISVLKKENVEFEPAAVRLIARKGSGSVRDSMSLLGQILSLSGGSLTESESRSILGLISQELYEAIIRAVLNQDCAAVSKCVSALFESGADIGFFLQEMGRLWRNLFLIRQSEGIDASLLNLSEEDFLRFSELARRFSPDFIHAAWQMVLEQQKNIRVAPDPAAALELFLLQLTLLPRLLSLETFSASPLLASADGADPLPNRRKHQESPAGSNPEKRIEEQADSKQVSTLEKQNAEQKTALQSGSSQEIRKTKAMQREPSGEDFLRFCNDNQSGRAIAGLLQAAKCNFSGSLLSIVAVSQMQYEKLQVEQPALIDLVRQYLHSPEGGINIEAPASPPKTEAELKAEYEKNGIVQSVTSVFDGHVVRCIQKNI